MIDEKIIDVGLKFGIYETCERRNSLFLHIFDHEEFSARIYTNSEVPLKFIVVSKSASGIVNIKTDVSVFDDNKSFETSISIKALSDIGFEWFETDKDCSTIMYNSLGSYIAQKKAFVDSNIQSEQVNHPSHYSWLKGLCGVEPIEICRCFDFSIGNALKYLMRKGKVDGDKTEKEKRIEDLKKAVFYIEDEIRRLEDGNKE